MNQSIDTLSRDTADRTYDVVIFGATGFTGGLTAEYLARSTHRRPLRWAIAGRDAAKLDGRVSQLQKLAAPGREPGVIVASVDDRASLANMAGATRVLATTVGPFEKYGDPVVEACVNQGTHYADITGEPHFVRRMLDRWHDEAAAKRLRIVNCCGFDSVPHDLGAYLTVAQLPPDQPLEVDAYVRGVGDLSGGTWHSAVDAFSQLRSTMGALGGLRASGGRRVRGGRRGPHHAKEIGSWAAPLPTIDPWIVLRSAAALERYGPNFRYGHFVRVASLPKLLAGSAMVAGVVLMAQVEATRKLLYKWRQPGDGPSPEKRARSSFKVIFLGRAASGERTRVEVSGGDPGYGETSKMLAESALSLANDGEQLPESFGVLTPAQAMGDALLERLRAAGIVFAVRG